mgnify:CR=1 FL=1
MQKNTIIGLFVVTLIVGLFAGYQLGDNRGFGHKWDKKGMKEGRHMMADGKIMNDGHMSMSDMMMDMNAALRGKTGDEFDQAFLSEMIVHHEGAVEMANLALTSAKHQEIKDLAKAIISAQNTEIASMKEWLKTWYNK